jgi:hypothetical protein
LGIHEPEEAKKHFEAILQFDSNNKAAANQVVICNAKIREQREKNKKLYSSIFNKMAENNRQVSEKNGGKWLYRWWDESMKGVQLPQLDVDLAQIERDKQEAVEQLKAERRKNQADFFKRYGGRKPNIVSVNEKPLNLNEDEGEKDDDKSSSNHQNAESTETPTESSHESSNDLRKCFRDSFLHDFNCGMKTPTLPSNANPYNFTRNIYTNRMSFVCHFCVKGRN